MQFRILNFLDSHWGARLVITLLAAVLVGITLGGSIARAGTAGFPVADAWIFQTFARNLATRGEIAFNLGVPVTGASSFAWLLIEALGYFSPFGPIA